MANWGKCDFKQLKKLRDQLDRIDGNGRDKDDSMEACAKEIAARLLRKVIKRTPVGNYSDGRIGGTLKKGWFVGGVTKRGNVYEIKVMNPIYYASYVEFGHRTRNGKGWVPGQLFLTISEKEVETLAPKLIEKKMYEFLKESFNVK
ncbi:MAG: HK97 gp10 family phage protein [Anaerovoracaceae bacterium]